MQRYAQVNKSIVKGPVLLVVDDNPKVRVRDLGLGLGLGLAVSQLFRCLAVL